MTPNQLQANRRNALKSTGPKTDEGKSRSRMNAIKNGMHSRPGLAAADDAAAYDALLAKLREDLDPRDALDNRLVASVAMSCWRRERALQAEAASLNLAAGAVEAAFEAEQLARLSALTQDLTAQASVFWRMTNIEHARATIRALLTFPMGCECLLSRLETLKARITQGRDSLADLLKSTVATFAGDESPLGRVALEHGRLLQSGEAISPPSADLASLAPLLDERAAQIRALRLTLLERQRLEITRRRLALALPDPATLEKILRYEKTIVNHLYRDLAHLERRRRIRDADFVPPAMNLAITSEK
jgi:hypothetical protein